MKQFIQSLSILSIIIISMAASCRREPYKPDFEHAGGYVIGKETCKSNPDSDYWLIDLSHPANVVTTYGDTITVEGISYTNMIKTTELSPALKTVGKKVSFDFRLSRSKVSTTGCTSPYPITYNLKEMQIIAQGEIR